MKWDKVEGSTFGVEAVKIVMNPSVLMDPFVPLHVAYGPRWTLSG